MSFEEKQIIESHLSRDDMDNLENALVSETLPVMIIEGKNQEACESLADYFYFLTADVIRRRVTPTLYNTDFVCIPFRYAECLYRLYGCLDMQLSWMMHCLGDCQRWVRMKSKLKNVCKCVLDIVDEEYCYFLCCCNVYAEKVMSGISGRRQWFLQAICVLAVAGVSISEFKTYFVDSMDRNVVSGLSAWDLFSDDMWKYMTAEYVDHEEIVTKRNIASISREVQSMFQLAHNV